MHENSSTSWFPDPDTFVQLSHDGVGSLALTSVANFPSISTIVQHVLSYGVVFILDALHFRDVENYLVLICNVAGSLPGWPWPFCLLFFVVFAASSSPR